MAFSDDLQEAADHLFDLAGEVVSYKSGVTLSPATAIFRALTVDDLVSANVMADAVICQIRVSELPAVPLRGDIVIRPMITGTQNLEVVERTLSTPGIWQLTCQQNIRVTP